MPHLPDHQIDHDPLLIAAFAAGDAEGADLERALDRIAACTQCAVLHDDLRAISTAIGSVPARTRTRDFRLTLGQANALRPAGWRRLLAPLAAPRFTFAAPLGGSLAALGLAGILVAGAAATPAPSTGAARDEAAGGAVAAGSMTAEIQLSAASPAAADASAPSARMPLPVNHTASDGEAAASDGPADPGVDDARPSAAPAIGYADGKGFSSVNGAPEGSEAAAAAGDAIAQRSASPSAPISPLLLAAVAMVIVGVALWVGGLVAGRTIR